MKDHRVPMALCPSCGYASDGAAGMSGNNRPKPDDLSICLSCGALAAFDERLMLKAIDQQATLDAMDAETRRKVELSQQFIRRRGPLQHKETRQ